jgi:hypothetical protein
MLSSQTLSAAQLALESLDDAQGTAFLIIVLVVAFALLVGYGFLERSRGAERRSARRRRAKQLEREERAARDAIEASLPRAELVRDPGDRGNSRT